AEPTAAEATAAEATATESAPTEPAATESSATESSATEPSAPNMAATEPTAAEPDATEPAAVEPAGIEGADIEPAGVEPARADPDDGPTDGAPAAVEQDALAPPSPQLDRSPATAGGSEDASDGPEGTVAAASVGMPSAAEWDEVAEFWALRPKPVVATPVPGDTGPEPSPWSAEEDEELVGLRGLAADWRAAQAAELAGTADGWQDDQRPRRWRRVVAPLAGRWSTLRTGERVNVVLYALTGVSIVAMALELLAGPDAAPTKLRTTPAPVVSPTTVRQSTTITFTIPTTTPEPAPAPAPASGPAPIRPPATVTQATTPPAPAPTEPAPPPPEPQPEPEPTAPPRTSPPTTRETPPTNPGFPEPTPPVLPSFP
ncbi:MAG: hypothetical protein QOI56_1967, partial [Actinomycetota bacterium]|nr:hypothetical protein [Actinomycetota bacterium]